MSNPSTPVSFSGQIPPPVLNLPFGTVQQDGQVYLSTTAIEFLQTLWAAMAGDGGVADLVLLNAVAPGVTSGATVALINEIAAALAILMPRSNAAMPNQVQDASLLLARPQIPMSIQALLDSLGADQGDILYRGANGWTVLAPGAAGQALETGGASANPSWATVSTSPPATTFAGLTATPADGQRAFITDGSVVATGNFGTVAAGGGANHVPVFWDGAGSTWRIG